MPRRKRRPRSKSAAAAVCLQKIGSNERRQWADENMIAAMESIKGGGEQSIKRAAELHGVPRITLQDRVKAKVMHGLNLGPSHIYNQLKSIGTFMFLTDVAQLGMKEQRSK